MSVTPTPGSLYGLDRIQIQSRSGAWKTTSQFPFSFLFRSHFPFQPNLSGLQLRCENYNFMQVIHIFSTRNKLRGPETTKKQRLAIKTLTPNQPPFFPSRLLPPSHSLLLLIVSDATTFLTTPPPLPIHFLLAPYPSPNPLSASQPHN